MNLLTPLSLQYPVLNVDDHQGEFHFRTSQIFPKLLLHMQIMMTFPGCTGIKKEGCLQPEPRGRSSSTSAHVGFSCGWCPVVDSHAAWASTMVGLPLAQVDRFAHCMTQETEVALPFPNKTASSIESPFRIFLVFNLIKQVRIQLSGLDQTNEHKAFS